jgi:hypothetical protein
MFGVLNTMGGLLRGYKNQAQDMFTDIVKPLQSNNPAESPFLNSPLNDRLQEIGQGILSFNAAAVNPTRLANGLLTKSPDKIPYLDDPNYSWFGDKRTHHHYQDPTIAKDVQTAEEKIGGFKNAVPFALMAAYMGGRVLRPITQHLPIVSLLFNPMVLGLGAGIASYAMAQNAKNDLTEYLKTKVDFIQNGNDTTANLLTDIHILTQNKSDRSNASFNNITGADKETLVRNADLLKSQIPSGKVTDIFSGYYIQSNGTQLFKKLEHSTSDLLFEKISSNQNLTDSEQANLLEQVGLSETPCPQGISEEKYLNHAKNLYKRRHSALNPVFDSIEQMINQDSQSLLHILEQNPMYKNSAAKQFTDNVWKHAIDKTSKYFSNHPDIMDITRSMLQKKWLDISKDHAQRFIK